jgi:hypothetical protein
MEYASKGVANAGLTTGIIGTALGAMGTGILPGLFGGNNHCCTSENMPVNRYEAQQSARIAELETEVKLRDANTYTDSKILELYRYVDGKFNGVEAQICHQAVVNAQVTANLSCLQNTVNVLSGLTKTIIPIDNICPPPMEKYNSWVAPTAPTT